MQSYVSHLLSDISDACRAEEPESSYYTSLEDQFEDIELWLEREPDHSFGYYCGLTQEQFPPADRLTEPQMIAICQAFGKLMLSWNLGADIPKDFPISRTYSLLVSILDLKVEIVTCGLNTVEFCQYYPDTCAFGEYCTCKEFFENDTDDEVAEDPDNPDILPF